MPDTNIIPIPDLWPASVAVNNVTPLAILRVQANILRKKTENLLQAEVLSKTSEGRTVHSFLIVAPALEYYRYKLFNASHAENRVYPATVQAPCFEDIHGDDLREASDQNTFLNLVKEILSSPDATSVVQSLIAQSNERIHPQREPDAS